MLKHWVLIAGFLRGYGRSAGHTEVDSLLLRLDETLVAGKTFNQKARTYQDSLLETPAPGSDGFLLESGVLYLKQGQLEAAENIYRDFTTSQSRPGTAAYARAAATLAQIYGQQGQERLQKKYRILSALSDVQAAVKENAALTDLAIQLYREGDITRANRYIEYALADASFYNARQRKIEISRNSKLFMSISTPLSCGCILIL